MFFKIGALKDFTISEDIYRCFPVNIANFLGTVFSKEQLRWLLLNT